MKIPRSILKVAAVCSSLLLGGGLIAYKSGGLPWLEPKQTAPPEEMHLSSSKYATVDVTTLTTTTVDHAYLAGSKSMPGIITVLSGTISAPPQPAPPGMQPPPTPVPTALLIPATSAQAVSPETLKIDPKTMKELNWLPPPAMLPGSKSIGNLGIGRPLIERLLPDLFPSEPPPSFSTAKPPSK